MTEPRGKRLVERYRANYGDLPDGEITEEMVLRHWELEKKLTRELLESSEDQRWDVTERCYTRLYGELDWLNRLSHPRARSVSDPVAYAPIVDVLKKDSPGLCRAISDGVGV